MIAQTEARSTKDKEETPSANWADGALFFHISTPDLPVKVVRLDSTTNFRTCCTLQTISFSREASLTSPSFYLVHLHLPARPAPRPLFLYRRSAPTRLLSISIISSCPEYLPCSLQICVLAALIVKSASEFPARLWIRDSWRRIRADRGRPCCRHPSGRNSYS